MLTETDKPPDLGTAWEDWRWQFRNSLTELEHLARVFSFSSTELARLKKIVCQYPFSITPYYFSLIDRNNPDDPIRRQCVPDPQEDDFFIEVVDDPLGEEKDSILPGLVHRYPDRVLLNLTDICPVLCRHCTRKRQWCKGKWTRTPEELEQIYFYILKNPSIRDVIISGGDPFALAIPKLEPVLASIRKIPHVEIIRIGTRCPVVLPQRIDDELVGVLKKYRPLWINTHFNHPNEITAEASRACDKILCAGIPLNNQSVLLKGVNDNVETMTKLCQGLLKIGVRPYYLFQCDPVSGTGHLRTSVDKGLQIIKGMRGFTSGLGVPTFVIDGPGGQGKIPLQPDCLLEKKSDYLVLKGYREIPFKYYNPQG